MEADELIYLFGTLSPFSWRPFGDSHKQEATCNDWEHCGQADWGIVSWLIPTTSMNLIQSELKYSSDCSHSRFLGTKFTRIQKDFSKARKKT